MTTRPHRCLYDQDLEPEVFAAMARRRTRNRRFVRLAALLVLLALPGWAMLAQPPSLLQAVGVGFASAFTAIAAGLWGASRRTLSYPEAFLAAGLEPLDLGGELEVAAILAAAPELRGEVACWVGHDLPLRERDLQALRRLAAQRLAPGASPWTTQEAA